MTRGAAARLLIYKVKEPKPSVIRGFTPSKVVGFTASMFRIARVINLTHHPVTGAGLG